MLPFKITKACDPICANVKGSLFLSMLLLVSLTGVALSCVKDKQVLPEDSSERRQKDDRLTVVTYFSKMLGTMKGLKKPMLSLMTITSINWLAWSMIFMYISDWMGRKVYGRSLGLKLTQCMTHATDIEIVFLC
ncbi:hypothetical protein Ahy_B04g071643 [Arachis hypogaea]|uniref:Uncharacterized protein n=1 Tax=Arachis hypogaea TaxID=3818 RepID=A0A444ZL75_ARAHY|nr:hypothetical protein Ahy_B04g071643 [Arachis hypogaea]